MSAIEEVRDRTDIVQLVSEYVEVKKAGTTHKALCPFHGEKTPSFVIYPDEGRWWCFGACATGGDVYDFVMRIENFDFRGALEHLARRAGVQLEPPSPVAAAKKDRRDRLREALSAADSFFQEQLAGPGGEPARQYLADRGYSGDVITEFGLGWAPDSWSAMSGRLKQAGFAEDDLLAAGLVRESDRGGVYDTFRGRLTIPIRDPQGRPVGFGARTLDPDGQPKYINSPQSEVFDKSRTLYALDRAASAIRAAERAVVVEGYTDVIRAHAAGHRNVVASLGTALTENHVARLKRYATTIVLALDADAAGTQATLRGLQVAQGAASGDASPVIGPRGLISYEQRLEVDLRVAILPPGKDPDDVIRADPEAWPRVITEAKPILGFLLDTLTADLDLDSPQGKTEASKRLLPIFETIHDPVNRAAWVGELADRIRVDARTLTVRRGPGGGRSRRRSDPPPWAGPAPAGGPDGPAAGPKRQPGGLAPWILGHLIRDPSVLNDTNDTLEELRQPTLGSADFDERVHRDLMEAVKNAVRGAPPPDTPDEHQLDRLPESHAELAEALITLVADEPRLPRDRQVRALRDGVLRLREQSRRRTLQRLRFLQADSDGEERAGFDRKVQTISAELVTLQRLLAANVTPQMGKLDPAVMRRREI